MSANKKHRISLRIAIAVISACIFLALPSSAEALTPIEQRHASDPALANKLGPSSSPEHSVGTGRVHDYKWGSLYWSSTTGVHEVHGAIRNRFRTIGGPLAFGWPKTDETDVVVNEQWGPLGEMNTFQNGVITWSSSTGAQVMRTPYVASWQDNFYPFLMMPMSSESNIPGGTRVNFANSNSMYWCSTCNGAHPVFDNFWGTPLGISQKWMQVGGPAGVLGLPIGDLIQHNGSSDGEQRFQHGVVLRKGDLMSPDYPAHEIHGPIYSKWMQLGGLSDLGFATSDVTPTPYGAHSTFEHGEIRYCSATNSASRIS